MGNALLLGVSDSDLAYSQLNATTSRLCILVVVGNVIAVDSDSGCLVTYTSSIIVYVTAEHNLGNCLVSVEKMLLFL